jgi:hypothetical protein
MSDHALGTFAFLMVVPVAFWAIRAECRFRRIKGAMTEVMHALLTESELTADLDAFQRHAMGVKLGRHSVRIAEWISGL